ncbi:MAG: hypothetical protein PHC29_06035 [Candidatus Omnitrophica bacterium]|nr:hypothetical protein [Candidatus Omnitrophota bacterium]
MRNDYPPTLQWRIIQKRNHGLKPVEIHFYSGDLMGILCFSVVLVIAAIVLHLILLKLKFRLPSNPLIAIILIFFFVLVAGFTISFFLRNEYNFLPNSIWEYLQVLIFYFPVMLSYVITYVALEDDSPSMTIARFVEQAKEKGRSRSQIMQIITNEALILPRIKIMLKDGWIEYKNGQYLATKKGRSYNQFFAFGLKLLRITREG